MFTISKQFRFEASHQLKGLPHNYDGSVHKCTRLHGHSYRVVLVLSAYTLDETGMVYDYAKMVAFKNYIDEHLDHRHLNDSMEQPTAEKLAMHLFAIASSLFEDLLVCVRVSETADTWASFDLHMKEDTDG